eukprot:m.96750 g.96750  ORF g.96750 m.96750 type:complete len:417 (-) comp15057_c0_seq9:50-1300(-)
MNGYPSAKRVKHQQDDAALTAIAQASRLALPFSSFLTFKCIAASCNPRAAASKDNGYRENPLQHLLVANNRTCFVIELRGWKAVDAFATVNPHGTDYGELKSFKLAFKLPEAARTLEFDPAQTSWSGQSDVLQHVYLTVRGTTGWQLEELKEPVKVAQDALPHHTFKDCLKHPQRFHNLTVRFDINPHLVAHSHPNRPEPGMVTDELGEHLPLRFFCHPSIPTNATASLYGITLSEWGGLQSLAFDTADTLYGPAPNPDAIPPVDADNHSLKLPLYVQPVTAAGSSPTWIKAVLTDVTLDALAYAACNECHRHNNPFYSCGHQAGTFTNPKMDCKLKDCATGLELPAVVFGTLVNKVLGLPLATKPWEEKDRVAKRANKMTKAQKPQVFRIKKQAWQGRVSLNVTEVEELEDVVVV